MAEERVESKGFYEMLWDCEFCGTRGLLAKSQRHCAECGGKQSSDKRYFPKEGEEKRVEGHKYEGADRYCPACNAPQGALAKNCTHCGSPLDAGREVKGVAAPLPPPRPKRRIWPWLVIAAVVVLGLGFLIWYRFIRTRSVQLTVAAHSWDRTIEVEEYGEQCTSAWRNEVPGDARAVSCHREQRSSRQVPDGEDCRDEKHDKKDGTFEIVKKCKTRYRSIPIDDDRCSYTVLRWQPVASAAQRSHGSGLMAQWPALSLPATGPQPVLGARRAGKRTETLVLELEGGQRCEVSEQVWRKYADGAKIVAEVRASSGNVVCSSL